MSHYEGDVLEYIYAVDFLADILNGKYFITDLSVGPEIDIRVFTARRTDVIELDLFKCALT